MRNQSEPISRVPPSYIYIAQGALFDQSHTTSGHNMGAVISKVTSYFANLALAVSGREEQLHGGGLQRAKKVKYQPLPGYGYVVRAIMNNPNASGVQDVGRVKVNLILLRDICEGLAQRPEHVTDKGVPSIYREEFHEGYITRSAYRSIYGTDPSIHSKPKVLIVKHFTI